MDISSQLTDAFDRVRHGVEQVLDGIDPESLTFRPDVEANTIAWLVWHLTRVQDDDVAAVRASAELLFGYYEVVHQATLHFVGPLRDGDLDRIVDERWDPPVTLGVRLVSVVEDDLQHVGQ